MCEIKFVILLSMPHVHWTWMSSLPDNFPFWHRHPLTGCVLLSIMRHLRMPLASIDSIQSTVQCHPADPGPSTSKAADAPLSPDSAHKTWTGTSPSWIMLWSQYEMQCMLLRQTQFSSSVMVYVSYVIDCPWLLLPLVLLRVDNVQNLVGPYLVGLLILQ